MKLGSLSGKHCTALSCSVSNHRGAGCPLFEWFLGLFPTFLILISLCTQPSRSNGRMLSCGQCFSSHVNHVAQLVRLLRIETKELNVHFYRDTYKKDIYSWIKVPAVLTFCHHLCITSAVENTKTFIYHPVCFSYLGYIVRLPYP